MAVTVASPLAVSTDRVVVLPRVGWETYERLLADDEERRVPRLTYDRGELAIVSPSPMHERDGFALAQVVGIVAEALGLDYLPMGATTFRSEPARQGFEADSSFYIQHERAMRDRAVVDLRVDPPPDLAIEIDVSHPSLDKLPIYAGVGVPEVWRGVGDQVRILVLAEGNYRESAASLALPPLTGDILTRFLVESRGQGRLSWVRMVRDWINGQLSGNRPTG